MPEAPWVKRTSHGINFTNHITGEGKDREKFQKFFNDKQDKKNSKKQGGDHSSNPNDRSRSQSAENNATGVPSAGTRLLNNMVAETVSDRHKISLIEDSSPIIQYEEDDLTSIEKMATTENPIEDSFGDQRSDRVIHDTGTDNESYDSEELNEKGTTDVMAFRASGSLIAQERDSMVNMGENLTKNNIRELRKMKREIVEPNLGQSDQNVKAVDLLPKVEEAKTGQATAGG